MRVALRVCIVAHTHNQPKYCVFDKSLAGLTSEQ